MVGEQLDVVREAFTFVDGLEGLSSVDGVCNALARKLASDHGDPPSRDRPAPPPADGDAGAAGDASP